MEPTNGDQLRRSEGARHWTGLTSGCVSVGGSSHHVALNNGGRQVAAHGFHLIDFYEKGSAGAGCERRMYKIRVLPARKARNPRGLRVNCNCEGFGRKDAILRTIHNVLRGCGERESIDVANSTRQSPPTAELTEPIGAAHETTYLVDTCQ